MDLKGVKSKSDHDNKVTGSGMRVDIVQERQGGSADVLSETFADRADHAVAKINSKMMNMQEGKGDGNDSDVFDDEMIVNDKVVLKSHYDSNSQRDDISPSKDHDPKPTSKTNNISPGTIESFRN